MISNYHKTENDRIRIVLSSHLVLVVSGKYPLFVESHKSVNIGRFEPINFNTKKQCKYDTVHEYVRTYLQDLTVLQNTKVLYFFRVCLAMILLSTISLSTPFVSSAK